MDYQDEEEEIEYYELIEDFIPDDSFEMEYFSIGTSPDPILIAVVTIMVGVFLFGFLTHFAFRDFNGSLSLHSDQSMNNQKAESDAVTNNPDGNIETALGKSWNGECGVSQQFPLKVIQWCALITQYATKHNLDPNLIAAVVWLESGGNELAYSRSGAVGLMQVMPSDGLAASFMCVNGPCFKDRPSTSELQDPEFNIAYGTRFLASQIRRYGNIRDALKSYGPMDAGYTYSDKVLSIFNRYKNN